ncbi:MAG: sigma-70 family RNA polymerase sigma factor [Ferruginibacter sp.]
MTDIYQFSEEAIIQKILEGEIPLFEILIRRYNAFLYKTGRSYNFNHEDTQDLMQDSFIAAYINLSKFEFRSSFKTWVIKIMLNNCYRKQHKASFKNEVTKEIDEKSTPMFSDQLKTQTAFMVQNKELSSVIENALQQLKQDYRLVFSLREISGLSIKETADALSISEVNVKVRLNRAKVMLKAIIERSYKAEDIFEFNLIYCDAIVHNVLNKIKEITK